MNDKEILQAIEDGELTLADLGTKLVTVTSISDGVTSEMIAAAKVSKELYEKILANRGPHALPSIVCHYRNGVLYPSLGRGQR